MELLNMPHRLSYRSVRYPRLEFKTGKLLIILPFGYKPNRVLEKHRGWILSKTRFISECLKEARTKKLVRRSEGEFKNLVFSCVKEASEDLGQGLNRIYFRMMRTKWASCSSRRNLTVNRLMRYLPESTLKYVVYHEIVHLIEKRHNDKFWQRISKRFNDYQELEKDLFVYWFKVAKRT